MTEQALAQDLCFVPETGSTNWDMFAALREKRASEGCWIIAERQTAGRGRQGREWIGAEGNFTGSTLVRLSAIDPVPTTLSLAAALAVLRTAHSHLPESGQGGARLRLKWPNDVELDGRKLSGILIEREGDHAVVGIGVNLAAAPKIAGRRTATLAEASSPPDPATFARALAARFGEELACWREEGAEGTIARWLAAAHPQGTPLTVHDQGGAPVSGTFAGLERDGALRLRLIDGAIRVIRAGDVEAGAF